MTISPEIRRLVNLNCEQFKVVQANNLIDNSERQRILNNLDEALILLLEREKLRPQVIDA